MKSVMVGIVMILLLLSLGCVAPFSATEALILSEDDVNQAISLREARDAKVCLKVDGVVDIDTIVSGSTGNVKLDGVVVTGKNASFADCINYFTKGVVAPSGPGN